MDANDQSPTHSESSENNEKELKRMLMYPIVSSPESSYTLDHKRQTQGVKKLIYCVRFDPDEGRYLAIGTYFFLPHILLRIDHSQQAILMAQLEFI